MNSTKQSPAFAATQGGKTTHSYYFALEGELPKKIADGSFGIVYEGRAEDLRRTAIKLFYATENEQLLKRIDEEIRAGQNLRAALEKEGAEALLGSNVVVPLAWTDKFLESPAYKALAGSLKASAVSVSQYAIVMDLFDCSLKELLEKGRPAGCLIGGEKVPDEGTPGYEILRGLRRDDRESAITAVVQDIVRGLLTLHEVKYSHHDLKPANVLVASRGAKLVVAIGDLGFLHPNEAYETALARDLNLPLGTRHYRSPEQRDYFDICEVEVLPADSGTRQVLATRDPKFRETLSAPGDIIVFSKDPKLITYPILEIDRSADGESTRIVIDAGDMALPPDRRTQIIVYKVHSERTDIFGVGAILYDMLSGGRSPERFYDKLRVHDHEGSSVAALVGRYEQFSTFAGASIDLEQAFRELQLSGQREYASAEIVQILLGCMLPQASDAYSRAGGIKALLRDLERLPTRFPGDSNPLWDSRPHPKPLLPPTRGFRDVVASVQALTDPRERFVEGYKWLRRVAATAAEGLLRGTEFRYAHVVPENVRVMEKEKLAFDHTAYESEEEYLRAVLGTDVALGGGQGGYPPYEWDVWTRRGIVEAVGDESGSAGLSTLKLTLLDSRPYWGPLETGDFLLLERGARRELLTVATVDGTRVQANHPATFKIDDWPKAQGSQHVTVVKRLDPVRFYMSTVASYVHSLFFVDQEKNHGSVPASVTCGAALRASGWLRSIKAPRRRRRVMGIETMDVHKFIAGMYVWCLFGDLEASPGEDRQTAARGEVEQRLEDLRNLLAKLLDVKPTQVEYWKPPDDQQVERAQPPLLDDLVSHIVRP